MRRRKSAVRKTLPDYTRVAMRYQNYIPGFTLNSSPVSTRQWRMNSMYDPNYTVTNPGQHQPYGFDQYNIFFQKYRVHAIRVRMEFLNPTPDTSGGVADLDLVCSMWPAPDTSTNLPGANMNILGEVAKAKNRVLSRKTGMAKRAVLKGYYKIHRLLGVSKKEYNTNANFEAFNGTNPVSTPLLNVLCHNPANALDNATYDLRINFVFYASMFRKRIPDMS